MTKLKDFIIISIILILVVPLFQKLNNITKASENNWLAIGRDIPEVDICTTGILKTENNTKFAQCFFWAEDCNDYYWCGDFEYLRDYNCKEFIISTSTDALIEKIVVCKNEINLINAKYLLSK